ncbi:3'-5' exonuclease [Lactococcus kimchii]|uniref:3'-5' exonuclease n=1 Tax=Lactococcus sp. S-13 TaxID=2507158 RepID=UPI001023AF59|nr:3'-5' exonuclease [Lactococcus sp. S-13]RZI48350.1 3'-5' exonuclease [Lactococcus sp. S-13]
MKEKYVVFDFETTGFSAQKNEIIQIGAVKYDENDVEIARFNQLVKNQRSYVSSEITELTGIKPADLLNQPTIEEILPEFLAFIEGHLLVAHNAPFDVSFLYQAIIDCALTGVEAFRVYDTLAESKRLLQMSSYALVNFKELLGVSDLRSHDALNDCLITAKLYHYLQKSEQNVSEKILTEILELGENADANEQLDLFGENTDEITESLRRKLNLPITKALVYYRQDLTRKWQKFDVTGIRIEQEYSTGASLSVTLYHTEQVRIHSDFLKEMQKANFVSEMEEEK